MLEYQDKMVPPEAITLVKRVVEIGEKTTDNEVIEPCGKMVEANIGNMLLKTIQGIDRRIQEVELPDGHILVPELGLLKAALVQLHQEVQFATYDYEYALIDKKDHIEAKINYGKPEFVDLSVLKGITWILEQANRALIRSNEKIDGLEAIQAESQRRLDDLEQENNSKKLKNQLRGTIKSRETALKPKRTKHRKLVNAINKLLKIDPKNTAALSHGAEDLLLFLAKNEWINAETTMQDATRPEGLEQEFEIEKIIEKTQQSFTEVVDEETRAAEKAAKNERNRKRRARDKRFYQSFDSEHAEDPMPEISEFDFVPVEGEEKKRSSFSLFPRTSKEWLSASLMTLALSFGINQCVKSQMVPIKMPRTKHLHMKSMAHTNLNGEQITVNVFCESGDHGLDDKEYILTLAANTFREIEFHLKDDRPLSQEVFDKSNVKLKEDPKAFLSFSGRAFQRTIKVTDFVEGSDGTEFIKTAGDDEPGGPFNYYYRLMARSAKVTVTFSGAINETYEETVTAKYKQKVKIRQADDDQHKD